MCSQGNATTCGDGSCATYYIIGGCGTGTITQDRKITDSNLGERNPDDPLSCGTIDFTVTDTGGWTLSGGQGDTPPFDGRAYQTVSGNILVGLIIGGASLKRSILATPSTHSLERANSFNF